MSLNNQSGRLADLGRREAVLAAIEEAVTIRRDLAAARPDAFLPDLATSLNNQSSCLADLGRREEALAAIEEAITIRRDLAVISSVVFASRLANSLDIQASTLYALGRPGEAQAAQDEADAIRNGTPPGQPELSRWQADPDRRECKRPRTGSGAAANVVARCAAAGRPGRAARPARSAAGPGAAQRRRLILIDGRIGSGATSEVFRMPF